MRPSRIWVGKRRKTVEVLMMIIDCRSTNYFIYGLGSGGTKDASSFPFSIFFGLSPERQHSAPLSARDP
jgi:hypothetical protein